MSNGLERKTMINYSVAVMDWSLSAPNPSAIVSSGPSKHFPFATSTVLRFHSRGHWKDTGKGRDFSY